MKIYTKTGDKGETGIIGKRVSKASRLVDAIGSLDELNASIGVIVAEVEDWKLDNDVISENIELKAFDSGLQDIVKELVNIQSTIFSVGGILANGRVKVDFKKETKILEKQIDKMDTNLEALQNFILPGGSKAAAHTHLARAICRGAERKLVELFIEDRESKEALYLNLESEILPYINRLSDYLFTLARYINKLVGIEEMKWNSREEK